MKKTFFGVCKECFSIKKFENIQPKKETAENMKVYVCCDCIIKSINASRSNREIAPLGQVQLF